MKVWVGCYDYGQGGGYSLPSEVFLSEESAEKWMANGRGTRDFVELEVDEGSALIHGAED